MKPFADKLRDLVIKHIRRTSNEFITDLLHLLRESGNSELPKCAKTFLKTSKCGIDYRIEAMSAHNGKEGSYCYLGIKNQLERYISPELYPSKKIPIYCNVDGIQLYEDNQRNECMWPILVKILAKKYGAKTFLVALFYGKSKPDSPKEFMQDFIDELNTLIRDGVCIQGTHYIFKFKGFICDIPA